MNLIGLFNLASLDACYDCEALGKGECGGGYKFLYQVLEFYGFRFLEIFLCGYQSKDPSKPKVHTSIEKVRENWSMVRRTLTKFYRHAFREERIYKE